MGGVKSVSARVDDSGMPGKLESAGQSPWLWLGLAVLLTAANVVGALAPYRGFGPPGPRELQCFELGAPFVFALLPLISKSQRSAAGYCRALAFFAMLSIAARISEREHAAEHAPQTFTSATGGFTIQTPVALAESVRELDTGAAGHLTNHVFQGVRGSAAFNVAYIDYPSEHVRSWGADRFLENVRDGMVAAMSLSVKSDSRVALGRYPGRALDLEGRLPDGSEGEAHIRLFLVENRLYEVFVVSARDPKLEAEAQRFLKTFLLEAAPRPRAPATSVSDDPRASD